MNKLSVVTIAKNEEKNINNFLNNLQWADEIVVVDNNSNDRTLEIASLYTKKIFRSDEINIGKLKNFALSNATKDWILLIDVDELISNKLRQEILGVLNGKTNCEAFYIPYQNHFLGRKITNLNQRYSKIRFFKKRIGRVLNKVVHEEVEVSGKVGKLKGKILHYSFRSVGQTLRKFTYYAQIEAPDMYKKGQRTTLKHLTMYPAHMFWHLFIEKKGYRDSIWGFGLALCFTYYEFARYTYLLKEQIVRKSYLKK